MVLVTVEDGRILYYRHLRRFETFFSCSQVKVTLFRDFVIDPLSVIGDVHAPLGVDEGIGPDVNQFYKETGQPIISWVDRVPSKSNPLRGIVELVAPGWLSSSLRRIKNANLARGTGASPAVREALLDVYRIDMTILKSWLDRDHSGWFVV